MKFIKDAEWQEMLDKVSAAETATKNLTAVTAERDAMKTRAEAAEGKIVSMEAAHKTEMESAQSAMTKMEADHKAALDKLSADHKAAMDKAAADHKTAMEAKDKSVNTVASQKAADIARTAGLDAPIAESTTAQTATDVAALREQMAVEKDPTKRANMAREIRRLTEAAKAKK
jgi:hypothetical protein